jgi:hypothetical protein
MRDSNNAIEKAVLKDPEIVPGVGIGPIKFGATDQAIEAILGPPSTTPTSDEEGDLAVHYDHLGLSFSFYSEYGFRLCWIEINRTAKPRLWGERIFDLRLESIKKLIIDQYCPYEIRNCELDSEDCEKDQFIMTVIKKSIDFYFDPNDNLQSIDLGLIFEKDRPVWPTG